MIYSCPICQNEYKNSDIKCQICGFDKPQFVFLSKDNANQWLETDVKPYRVKLEASKREAELLSQIEGMRENEKNLKTQLDELRKREKKIQQQPIETNKESAIAMGLVCTVCGYIHSVEQSIKFCPQCKAPPSKFKVPDTLNQARYKQEIIESQQQTNIEEKNIIIDKHEHSSKIKKEAEESKPLYKLKTWKDKIHRTISGNSKKTIIFTVIGVIIYAVIGVVFGAFTGSSDGGGEIGRIIGAIIGGIIGAIIGAACGVVIAEERLYLITIAIVGTIIGGFIGFGICKTIISTIIGMGIVGLVFGLVAKGTKGCIEDNKEYFIGMIISMVIGGIIGGIISDNIIAGITSGIIAGIGSGIGEGISGSAGMGILIGIITGLFIGIGLFLGGFFIGGFIGMSIGILLGASVCVVVFGIDWN